MAGCGGQGCPRRLGWACDWDETGGSLEYDISHLHPDWDLVIQAYEIRSITYSGQLVYASDFTLYLHGSAVPADFSGYPKAVKQQLWAIVFAIKRKLFLEVQPDVVEHFIKAPYQVAARLALYRLHLDLQNYDVAQTTTTFTFFRRKIGHPAGRQAQPAHNKQAARPPSPAPCPPASHASGAPRRLGPLWLLPASATRNL